MTAFFLGDDTMDRLKTLALRLLRDEEGQDLIEYALLATFVSLVAIAGATLLGTALNNWYSSVSDRVDTAASGAGS
jgi:pilus assembly protein Flp/PilA